MERIVLVLTGIPAAPVGKAFLPQQLPGVGPSCLGLGREQGENVV